MWCDYGNLCVRRCIYRTDLASVHSSPTAPCNGPTIADPKTKSGRDFGSATRMAYGAAHKIRPNLGAQPVKKLQPERRVVSTSSTLGSPWGSTPNTCGKCPTEPKRLNFPHVEHRFWLCDQVILPRRVNAICEKPNETAADLGVMLGFCTTQNEMSLNFGCDFAGSRLCWCPEIHSI